MEFKELNIKPYYNTSDDDLINDFFSPCLKNAIKYDRGVGFFSSGWLKLACYGMNNFAQNNGKARWVTSPILSKRDWEAIQYGDKARRDYLLLLHLEKNIFDLELTLSEDTLSGLAWLVGDNIIDFRIALPRNKLNYGDFHDKFGIFYDDTENIISFNGSYNDSIQGTKNYESIKVFKSWEAQFHEYIDSDIDRFEKLWADKDPNVKVFNLPESAKEKIIRYRKSSYPVKKWNVNSSLDLDKVSIPSSIILREYQKKAINNWFENNFHGIFEMATGTGKTITALAAICKLLEKKNRSIILITCPYTHLVSQWSEESKKFNLKPILLMGSKAKWIKELALELNYYRKGYINHLTIITTNASLISGKLFSLLSDNLNEVILVADEAHHWGSKSMLLELNDGINYRLGLSATPKRFYDEDGSEKYINYFGNVIFEFSLKDAIGKYLTPYYYHPIPVSLSDEEFFQYIEISKKISKIPKDDNGDLTELAKNLLIKRARICNNSINKYFWVEKNIVNSTKLDFSFIYLGDKLFDPILRLLGKEKGIRLHEFTGKESIKQRKSILEDFSKGNYQALLAMKCLDEGVDVPPTKTAYFIASSGNPREFVQRRGRILRKFPGKEYAIIYDLISVPPVEYFEINRMDAEFNIVKSILRKEFRRISDFTNLAINKYTALEQFIELADRFDLLDTL